MMVGGIGAADNIGRQPLFALIPREGSNGEVVNTPPKSQITASTIFLFPNIVAARLT